MLKNGVVSAEYYLRMLDKKHWKNLVNQWILVFFRTKQFKLS